MQVYQFEKKFSEDNIHVRILMRLLFQNFSHSTIFHLHDSTAQKKTVLDLYFVRAGKYILTIKVIPYTLFCQLEFYSYITTYI